MQPTTLRENLKIAQGLVLAYQEMVRKALEFVKYDHEYGATVENEESAHIEFEGENVVLKWWYYESGWYDSGSVERANRVFPSKFLFMSDEVLKERWDTYRKAAEEQKERLRKAQEAVARERAEEKDRKDYERLQKKYGGKLK